MKMIVLVGLTLVVSAIASSAVDQDGGDDDKKDTLPVLTG